MRTSINKLSNPVLSGKMRFAHVLFGAKPILPVGVTRVISHADKVNSPCADIDDKRKTAEKRLSQILDFIIEEPGTSIDDCCCDLEISEQTFRNHIATLLDRGLVVRINPVKKGPGNYVKYFPVINRDLFGCAEIDAQHGD
jgi:predicted HTH transcriptional regulator